MKNLKKKKGFTLIELMIVLAIIGILAVVLVPKVGTMKGQARNTGVITNATSVRAFLETKVGSNYISTTSGLYTSIDNAFKDDKITNPINNSTTINDTNLTSASGAQQSVYVTTLASEPNSTAITYYPGTVIVLVDSTNKLYKVYGVDKDGAKINSTSYDIK